MKPNMNLHFGRGMNLRFDFLYACSVGHIRTAACVPDGIVIVLFRYYSGMM